MIPLHLELYASGNSFLHRRKTRAKLIALGFYLGGILITPWQIWTPHLIWISVAVALLALSELSLRRLLLRMAGLTPFVVLLAVSALFYAPLRALEVAVRSLLALAGTMAILSTITAPQLLQGLRELGLPPLLVEVLGFLLRYLHLIGEEAERMVHAAESRTFANRIFPKLRSAVGIVGILFLRTWERSERIWQAMLARGYSGRSFPRPAEKWNPADWTLALAAAATFTLAFFLR